MPRKKPRTVMESKVTICFQSAKGRKNASIDVQKLPEYYHPFPGFWQRIWNAAEMEGFPLRHFIQRFARMVLAFEEWYAALVTMICAGLAAFEVSVVFLGAKDGRNIEACL